MSPPCTLTVASTRARVLQFLKPRSGHLAVFVRPYQLLMLTPALVLSAVQYFFSPAGIRYRSKNEVRDSPI